MHSSDRLPQPKIENENISSLDKPTSRQNKLTTFVLDPVHLKVKLALIQRRLRRSEWHSSAPVFTRWQTLFPERFGRTEGFK